MSLAHVRRRIQQVQELYGVHLTVKPGRLRDHLFAREVLIERTKKWGSYTESTGLREHPQLPPEHPGGRELVIRPRWPGRDGPDD